MDQQHYGLATDGQHEVRLDWQTNRAPLQESLDKLYETVNRLYALQPEYWVIVERAQCNLADAHALVKDINTFAICVGISPIPRHNGE